ncbi:MAG: hypothetical protein GWP03_01925 [Proteobacteria bacterium]|nr:hypothetical protein [Pseudomonadota bacterium]
MHIRFDALRKTNALIPMILMLGVFLVPDVLIYPSSNSSTIYFSHKYYVGKQSIVYENYRESNVNVADRVSKDSIPPLNFYRIAGECLGGAAVGMASALGTYFIYVTGANHNIWGGGSEWAITSMDIGWIIGNQFGAYIAGNIGNETGSIAKTVLYGTAISTVLQVITFGVEYYYTSNVVSGPSDTPIFGIVEIASPIIGAVIGFNLTRRYKSIAPKVNGLINMENKKVCLNIPGIFTRSINGETILALSLIDVKF